MAIDIHGTAEPPFAAVRDAFARNFEDLNESGAAVSVYQRGRKVVDLWAGAAGSPASAEWTEDTMVTVFSTTKGAAAITALMLADRGALDLDAPVARYWPEFAAAGKERIPVRMVLSHQAGLPVVDAALTFEDVLAGEPVVRALAAQRPIWEPGSKHGYHGLTYGWLVGELVRRVTGRSLGRFFASEAARPLGLDFFIGLPESEERRVAPVVDGPPPTDPATLRLMASLSEPGSLFWRMGTLNGAIPFAEHSVAGVYNMRRVHAAEIPAANGITTARSLARLYAATFAEVDGIRLFGPETLRRALEVTSEGPDALLGVRLRFGLGFGRHGGDVRLLGPDSYGHGGAGGSFGFADPPSGIAFGYVMKQMGSALIIDPRAERLIDAVRASLKTEKNGSGSGRGEGKKSGNGDIGVFYALGLERDRLASGPGALELARTKALLERYLPPPPAAVADVGGGPGRYALWLAERGYRVHLVDPVPVHIEQARAASRERAGAALAGAEVGDARALRLPDGSADAVLLMGPLYHLQELPERIRALAEARRVCRPGGVIIAAAISRFASTLDGLRGGYLEDPAFAAMAEGDRRDGCHRNPTGHPAYFTTAYFHRPEDLAAECAAAGLAHEATLAVEGPAWLLPDLDSRLAGERSRAVLLGALAATEAEPALLGVSAHLLAVFRRP